MASLSVQTLDLTFQGIPGAIAAYLVPHRRGAVLVECGPGSTIDNLVTALAAHGLQVGDISDVLLTHIHLDHAGAAGWLALQGACIHVHPKGAPHLLNPEKLIASAARIYGDQMGRLWGEFLPVPANRLSVLQDGQEIDLEGLKFRAVDTPGHASHHFVYILDDWCFSGDIGGVRVGGRRYLRLPMPPPEFNLEEWRSSLDKLHRESFRRIAPTHFGIYDDPQWHLAALGRELDEVEAWIEEVMPAGPGLEELRSRFQAWVSARARKNGLEPAVADALEAANPSFMSADGIQRYWKKFRQDRRPGRADLEA